MDKNKYLTCSKNMSEEYCCTIVRLGEILEIPGAKTIAKTIVNGRTIIVSKNQKEGDIMFYVSNESQINADFLSVNNQFHDIERNANCGEIEQYLIEHPELSDEEKKEYLKYNRGYFNEHGRVKMTRMFNEVSMGYLFPLEFMVKWCPKMLFGFILADMVGYQFDTVNGENFVKPYVPYKRVKEFKGNKVISPKLAQYDRLVPGQFEFNYSTNLFELNMHRFYPETPVIISNKIHGTSFIIGNVLTNKPLWGGLYEKIFIYLPKFLQKTEKVYDVIYSSRKAIKNQFIRRGKVGYSADLDATFDKYYELLKNYIPEGYTMYAEIFGYHEGLNSFIQPLLKGYDYKCEPGKNKIMPYRVTITSETGYKKELEISEVIKFTRDLKNKALANEDYDVYDRIFELDIMYEGRLCDLYPEIDKTCHWNENFLERIKNDTYRFGMELDEPLCRNKVPREGLVFRVINDPVPEAFKLKTIKFLEKEGKAVDKGIIDAESIEGYG